MFTPDPLDRTASHGTLVMALPWCNAPIPGPGMRHNLWASALLSCKLLLQHTLALNPSPDLAVRFIRCVLIGFTLPSDDDTCLQVLHAILVRPPMCSVRPLLLQTSHLAPVRGVALAYTPLRYCVASHC